MIKRLLGVYLFQLNDFFWYFVCCPIFLFLYLLFSCPGEESGDNGGNGYSGGGCGGTGGQPGIIFNISKYCYLILKLIAMDTTWDGRGAGVAFVHGAARKNLTQIT